MKRRVGCPMNNDASGMARWAQALWSGIVDREHKPAILAGDQSVVRRVSLGGSLLGFVVLWTLAASASELDSPLRLQLQQQGINELVPPTPGTPAKFELGRLLFFDKHLSGNQNIACASCHHPSLTSGDARSLPSGTGGEGLGPERTTAAGHVPIPRNSPEVFFAVSRNGRPCFGTAASRCGTISS